jgi:YVTN family beta-propeller protein
MKSWSRREFMSNLGVASVFATIPFNRVFAQSTVGPNSRDRVIICNEDSNTLSVIDPNTNTIATTINLTSFDEDPGLPSGWLPGALLPVTWRW